MNNDLIETKEEFHEDYGDLGPPFRKDAEPSKDFLLVDE
jgi:hypothetical protein